MTKYWIAVACREHVLGGIKLGVCQVCHGKQSPLALMTENDWIIYYSPTMRFGEKLPCKKFTAIGKVLAKAPYQFQMSDDFIPWRRDVAYAPAKEVAIEPLIDSLSFIKDKKRWGFPFRRGVFSVPYSDFLIISKEMELYESC